MSFDILAARMYGTGALGDVTNPVGQINSYAKVTKAQNKTITIDLANASLGAYETFEVGTEILLHISGVISPSADVANLGKYKFVKIMQANGNVLTLNTTPLSISTTDYLYQAITVAQFKTLTVSETISPIVFNETKGYGGILAIKCSVDFNLTGSINLVDKGLLTASYRPLLNQEQNGTLDTDQLSGYENYDTATHFVLNKGDGACMIIVKKLTCNSNARIGNPALKGIQRCRGAEDSYNLPTGVTNIGGSSILIVTPAIPYLPPNMIAKYRSKTLEAGKGLCRCYIATEATLPNDEGLYAYDVINTPTRLKNYINFGGFGDGSQGELTSTNMSKQQNSYAQVKSVSEDGYTYNLVNINQEGVAKFTRDALVMIHITPRNNSTAEIGRFFLSKIVSIKNNTSGTLTAITLANPIKNIRSVSTLVFSDYFVQVIAIPQYSEAVMNGTNSKTLSFEKGRGGIFAIAVNGTFDLSDGTINVEGKGGGTGAIVGSADGIGYSLAHVSCARMKFRLPIGHGHGSVFILANNLIMNSETRIGATYSGNTFGGMSGRSYAIEGGGYKGADSPSGSSGGSGAQGGTTNFDMNNASVTGGFAGNGNARTSYQGAHIFIVAQKITGCRLAALSTGGAGGSVYTGGVNKTYKVGWHGGCGYGGGGGSIKDESSGIYEAGSGGGVHGGGAGVDIVNGKSYGGGASGFCCIYANQVVSQNTTNLTVN